jgi:hypothetical protein
MAGDDDMDLMTARAAPGMRKDPHTKKPPAKQAKINSEGEDALYKVSEYSLSEFLDNEPDLYSMADIKVRYK